MTSVMTLEDEQVLREALHQIIEEQDAELLQEIEEANNNPDFAFTERDREWLESTLATLGRATA